MRHQGKLTTWKEEKGFGFITPRNGGEPVFVHIKAFLNRARRPVASEDVTYKLTVDAKGRARADKVAYADDGFGTTGSLNRGTISVALVGLFIGVLLVLVHVGKLPLQILYVYAGLSVIAVAAYGLDKSAAVSGHRRIKETTLHLFGLVGGWPGALLAQNLFRHKSRKISFQIEFWITVVLNCGVLWWISTPSGRAALRAIPFIS